VWRQREISPTGGDLMYPRRAVYNSSGRRYTRQKEDRERPRRTRRGDGREADRRRGNEGEKERETEIERRSSKGDRDEGHGGEQGIRFGLAPATPAPTPSDVGGPSLGAAIATAWRWPVKADSRRREGSAFTYHRRSISARVRVMPDARVIDLCSRSFGAMREA